MLIMAFLFSCYKAVSALFAITKNNVCISILVAGKLNSSCILILLYNIFFLCDHYFKVQSNNMFTLGGGGEEKGFIYQNSQAAAFLLLFPASNTAIRDQNDCFISQLCAVQFLKLNTEGYGPF